MSSGSVPPRILLADDDDAFRLVTSRFLRESGCDCAVAADGAAAVEQLRQREFDLLISDIDMPGNAGLELVREVPQVAEGLPILLLTGHPTVQTAVQSVRLSVVAYLVKPTDPDELLALVQQAVANYRAYRAVARNRRHLQDWTIELEQIEDALKTSAVDAAASPLEVYLSLTLRNLLTALVELKQLTETVALRQPDEGNLQRVALVRALQETIGVLEGTKQNFKSRELGELRRKLESLLKRQP